MALRDGGKLYYLLGDHLGSTSVTVDSNGVRQGELWYKAWGETRGTAFQTTPTHYRFTGQRAESDLKLHWMGFRMYDPVLGRFIQADTIVPAPGNPQSLNRYAYSYGNPLKYTDPSGHFSEDQIMQYFDVDSWEAVVAQFGQGGVLEGRWGWLEILRNAKLGHSVTVRRHYSTWPNNTGEFPTIFTGEFSEQNGQLAIRGSYGAQAGALAGTGAVLSATAAAALVPSSGSSGGIAYEYWSSTLITASAVKWIHPKLDPSKVDWWGAGMDAAGIAADVVTAGVGGRIVNGIQVAKVTGSVGKALDYVAAGRAVVSASSAAWAGNFGWGDFSDVGLAGAGLFIPVVPDAVSLITNLGGAMSWMP